MKKGRLDNGEKDEDMSRRGNDVMAPRRRAAEASARQARGAGAQVASRKEGRSPQHA